MNKAIRPLILVNILCVSAMMSFLAVVGPIVRELGLKEWHAGLSVAFAGVLWILTSRFWGRRSDIRGRKPVLISGITGFAVSYLLLALFIGYALKNIPAVIVSLAILILTRGLIGAFYAAISPVSAAIAADNTEPHERASVMAVLGASNGIGMIIGPVIGGTLASFGLAFPLFAASFMPVLAALVVYIWVARKKPCVVNEQEKVRILDKRLRLPMVAAFMTMYSVVTSQICLGFYVIDRLGLTPVSASKVTGYTLAIIGIVFIGTQIAVTAFKKVPPMNWLRYGSALSAIGYVGVTLMNSQVTLMLGFCVAIAGMGAIFPAFQALAANSVTKTEQGAAAGTVAAAQGIGIIAGPLVSTALYGIEPSLPFMVVVFAFGGLSLYSWKKKEHVCLDEDPVESEGAAG